VFDHCYHRMLSLILFFVAHLNCRIGFVKSMMIQTSVGLVRFFCDVSKSRIFISIVFSYVVSMLCMASYLLLSCYWLIIGMFPPVSCSNSVMPCLPLTVCHAISAGSKSKLCASSAGNSTCFQM